VIDEHDSFTYTLAELDDRFAVFRQDSATASLSIPISQWHAWNRPTQLTARMGPAA
jgi:anthranilate/para-aminobenzoate synthase component II